jgi:hypothetical protein
MSSGPGSGKLVRLPISSTRRTQQTYAKLLKRFDPRSRTPFEWAGRFLRPGSQVPESELWPDGTFPRNPIIVEFAGAISPARGWQRHQSEETAVLWRYDRELGEFHELGRVVAAAGMWARLLEPLVREAMQREAGISPVPDFDLIRERITRLLAAELDLLPEDRDRSRLLTIIHDELAFRMAEWDSPVLGEGQERSRIF